MGDNDFKYWGRKTKGYVVKHPTFRRLQYHFHPGGILRDLIKSQAPRLRIHEIYKTAESDDVPLLTSEANEQGVFCNEAWNSYMTQLWIARLRNKYYIDMVRTNAPNGSGAGQSDGTVGASTMMHTTNLEISNFVRTYRIQNPTRAPVKIRFYRYVSKQTLTADYANPRACWIQDLLDDNILSASTTPTTHLEETINTLGKRPNNKCKVLNRFWYCEKVDEYSIPPGATVYHRAHIPNMTLPSLENQERLWIPVTGATDQTAAIVAHLTRMDMLVYRTSNLGWLDVDEPNDICNRIVNPACVLNIDWKQTYTVRGINRLKTYAQVTVNNILLSDTTNMIDAETNSQVHFLHDSGQVETDNDNMDNLEITP